MLRIGKITALIHPLQCAREKISIRASNFDFDFLGEWNHRQEAC